MDNAKKQMRAKYAIFVASVIVLLTISICISAVAITSTGLQQQQAEAETPLHTQPQTCTHNWQKEFELVHYDAVTHDVYHEPSFVNANVKHTVCNTCKEVIDGATAEHAELTGHSTYTTDVPLVEQHIATNAWTETVVDEEAHDELVAVSKTCTICGATQEISDDE